MQRGRTGFLCNFDVDIVIIFLLIAITDIAIANIAIADIVVGDRAGLVFALGESDAASRAAITAQSPKNGFMKRYSFLKICNQFFLRR